MYKRQIVHTTGNRQAHIILRGGTSGTNYDEGSIAKATSVLERGGAPPKIIVDCSHGNSLKDHKNQPKVAGVVGEQIANGNRNIKGVMLESYIHEGNQKLSPGKTRKEDLTYGVSVTDACINLEDTAKVLQQLSQSVQARRSRGDASSAV